MLSEAVRSLIAAGPLAHVVTLAGDPEILADLAKTYLGPDVAFPPMPDPPPGFVTRITVDRLSGLGRW